MTKHTDEPALWFPTLRAGTGADVFTQRLVEGLQQRGLRAQITWLPPRAEYAPWTINMPAPPAWANLVHANTWMPSHYLPDDLPVVATLHHSVHHADLRPYKGWARAAYHRYWIAPNERRVLRRADYVIAVSHFVAQTAKRSLLDVPMQVIHNGIDTQLFRPGNRQRHPDESFRLLYVGSWQARKGVDLLAPIMRELGDGFELRYTGGDAAAKAKPHMPANMHAIGRLDGDAAVIAAMHDADALLFPSRSEGFPLVAIEALACGLPVIAARASSLEEAIDEGVTGSLCTPEAVTEFVASIRHLASDDALRVAMASNARRKAVDAYGLETMVDAYVEVYRQCLSAVPATHPTSAADLPPRKRL